MPRHIPTDRPAASAAFPPGPGWRAIVLLAACFLLVKLPFLVWSPYTHDEEEVKPGAVAHILLTDPRLPLSEYVLGGYEGGVLVVALAAVPFEVVFGHTVLAYKILAICVSLGILVFASLLAGRIAGNAAGLIAGALVIFSPPYLTQFQFILWGNYVESTLLALACFFLLHKLLFRDGSIANAAVLGLLCGLGVFIHYGFAVAVIAVVLTWYLVDHRLALRPAFWLFAACAVVGFAPWIAYNASHGFAGLGRVADGVVPQTLAEKAAGFVSRLGELLSVDYAMAWHFKDVGPIPGKLLGYAYAIVLAAGFAGLLVAIRSVIGPAIRALLPSPKFDLPRDPKTAAAIFPIFVAGYWAVYCGTNYGLVRAHWGNMDPETHVHIFLTFYPLLVSLAMAIGFAARRRAAWTWLALPPIALGMVGNAALLDFNHTNAPYLRQNYAVYTDAVYSEIGYTYAASGGDWRPIAERLDAPSAVSFFYGFGSGIGERNVSDPRAAVAVCDSLAAPELRAVCLFGAGAGTFQNYDAGPAIRDRAVDALSPEDAVWFIGGAADILLMEGYTDHPLIARARSIFFADDFGADFPPIVRGYVQSRLSAARLLSTKD